MASASGVKNMYTDTDLDNTRIVEIRPLRTAAADFSTTYLGTGNTLYLQPGERLLLLRWTPSAPKVKPCDLVQIDG